MTYCILDIDTSGLSSDKNCIVRIEAILTDDNFNVVDKFSELVKPVKGKVVEGAALAFNKLNLEELQKAPDEAWVLEEFNRFLLKHGAPVYVGFNIHFDMSFLKAAMLRNESKIIGTGEILDLNILFNSIHGSKIFRLSTAIEHTFKVSTGNQCEDSLKLLQEMLCNV